MEAGMKCVKFLLFIFNFIFFIVGLALIIVGAVVQTKLSAYTEFFNGTVNVAAIALIVIGGIVFIIGFFGCCGAYKEHYCMTLTFSILLAIVFIIEIAVGVAAYVARGKVKTVLEEQMQNTMKNYNDKDNVKKAWDGMQTEFQCCGVSDDKGASEWDEAIGLVPSSCCKSGATCSDTSAYKPGCLNELFDWISDNIYLVGGVGIGMAFIQLVGIIIACCLAQTIRKEYESV